METMNRFITVAYSYTSNGMLAPYTEYVHITNIKAVKYLQILTKIKTGYEY